MPDEIDTLLALADCTQPLGAGRPNVYEATCPFCGREAISAARGSIEGLLERHVRREHDA